MDSFKFLWKHAILSNRICNACLHASCVASTFDFADCSKKRDQCDIPLIATFFPRITKKLSQMKSKPKMSRFLWCLTLNHLTMIQMNKRRIAEGPLSIWIKLNELTNCVLRVLYGSFFASAANGQSLSCH